jgi:hypothetical protein
MNQMRSTVNLISALETPMLLAEQAIGQSHQDKV